MIFNKTLGREIPEGWVALSLEERLNFDRGTEFGSDLYVENPIDKSNFIKFYRVGDMDDMGNNYIATDSSNIPMLATYDLAVSFDGSVGRIAFGLNGSYSSGIRKISDKQKRLDSSTLMFIFKSEFIQKTIEKYASGSNILHASASIPYLYIPFNDELYFKFQELVKPIYQQMVANKTETKNISAIRDYLLPLLMNSQIEVID